MRGTGNIAAHVMRREVEPRRARRDTLLRNIWASATNLNSLDLVRQGGRTYFLIRLRAGVRGSEGRVLL
jgi:hypothetical protein